MKEKILRRLLILNASLCLITAFSNFDIDPFVTSILSVTGLLCCVCYFLKK